MDHQITESPLTWTQDFWWIGFAVLVSFLFWRITKKAHNDLKTIIKNNPMDQTNKKNREKELEKLNNELQNLQNRGYSRWNNHPGYTINDLNEMLKPHNLQIQTTEREEDIYYRITPLQNHSDDLYHELINNHGQNPAQVAAWPDHKREKTLKELLITEEQIWPHKPTHPSKTPSSAH